MPAFAGPVSGLALDGVDGTLLPVTPTSPPAALVFNATMGLVEVTPDDPGTIPDEAAAWLYDRTGSTLIARLANARSIMWQDSASGIGTATFEVPLADAGAVADRSIVKFSWMGAIRFGCVIHTESCSLAADGTVWVRYENQPGLLSLLADANAYPEYGLERNGGTVRHFGFMSKRGLWYRRTDWNAPEGFTFNQGRSNPKRGPIPSSFTAANSYWISAAGPDVNVPESAINYYRREFSTDERVSCEIEISGDNFPTLYLDGEELLTPDPADPHGWYTASTVRVSIPQGSHVLAASVANSYYNGGLFAQDHRPNPIALIATVWRLNADGERTSILFKTTLTQWVVSDGDPEPGWARAQVLRSLILEARQRASVAGGPPNGPSFLHLGFSHTHDTDGHSWTDNGQYTVDVGSVNLADIAVGLCEDDLDIWVDPVSMTLCAYKLHGADLTGSVELEVGGNLLEYTTSKQTAQTTSVLMRLAGDTWFLLNDDDAIDDVGLIETGLDVGSTSSRVTATGIGQTLLDQSSEPKIVVTAKTSALVAPRPYLEFNNGDRITGPGHKGVGTLTLRCLSITADFSGETPDVYADFMEDDA